MRKRISWLVVATTSAVVVSFVVPLCLLVRTLAEDRALAAADQEARNVAILVATIPDRPELADLVASLDERGTATTSVLTTDGTQIGGGPAMAGDAEVARAQGGEGFRVVDSAGGRVLLPVIVSDGTAVVRSTVTPADLHHGVARAWAGIIGLGVVLLVAALAVAARLGRRISEPVRDVAQTAHRLREGELAARAEVRGPPETQELARALNGLAERTGELLAHERAAVADLSHRLRTPVTALRLDAEGVADRSLAVRLQEHIAVLQRTIDAIVTEARRPVRTDLAPRCDATRVVDTRLRFWEPLAEDQGRPLQVQVPDLPLEVSLAEQDLADIIDVLIDNVFAHTPEGVPLSVSLERDATDPALALLTVADAGPGFPPAGVHQEGRVGTSGLGLDLVGRTAEGCGGSLRTGRTHDGGALAEVRLPLSG